MSLKFFFKNTKCPFNQQEWTKDHFLHLFGGLFDDSNMNVSSGCCLSSFMQFLYLNVLSDLHFLSWHCCPLLPKKYNLHEKKRNQTTTASCWPTFFWQLFAKQIKKWCSMSYTEREMHFTHWNNTTGFLWGRIGALGGIRAVNLSGRIPLFTLISALYCLSEQREGRGARDQAEPTHCAVCAEGGCLESASLDDKTPPQDAVPD